MRQGWLAAVVLAGVGVAALLLLWGCEEPAANVYRYDPPTRRSFEGCPGVTDEDFEKYVNAPDPKPAVPGWEGPHPGRQQDQSYCASACNQAHLRGADHANVEQMCKTLFAVWEAGRGSGVFCVGNDCARDTPNVTWCPVCSGFSGGSSGTSGTGKVIFWTNASRGWTEISIKVNGKRVRLTAYRNEPPKTCSTSSRDSAVVSLPVGTHKYEARSNRGNTWTGTVKIKSDGCLRFRLSCGDDRDCSK